MSHRLLQTTGNILAGCLVVLAFLYAFRLAQQPDWRDALRRADALLTGGQYRAASTAYNALIVPPDHEAVRLARLGMAATLRGEAPAAQRLLARSLGAGLAGRDAELVRLYQAQAALLQQQPEEAARFWHRIPLASPLRPVAAALWGTERMRAGDLDGGVPLVREAARQPLPAGWHERIAALVLVADALAPGETSPIPHTLAVAHAPLVTPLLPALALDVAQVKAASTDAVALGRVLLDADLPALATRAFASTATPTAQAWAAYARWQAGGPASLNALQELAASQPDSAIAQSLLVLTALATNDRTLAATSLERARELAPAAAETHLAEAQWFASDAAYPQALRALQQALAASPPAQRGAIARTLADLSVQTGVETCTSGQQAAALATRLEPRSAPSFELYAATLAACGDAGGALAAADAALALAPDSPAAYYYRGRALLAQGNRPAARQAFTSAADLAASSVWRERAETQLALLP